MIYPHTGADWPLRLLEKILVVQCLVGHSLLLMPFWPQARGMCNLPQAGRTWCGEGDIWCKLTHMVRHRPRTALFPLPFGSSARVDWDSALFQGRFPFQSTPDHTSTWSQWKCATSLDCSCITLHTFNLFFLSPSCIMIQLLSLYHGCYSNHIVPIPYRSVAFSPLLQEWKETCRVISSKSSLRMTFITIYRPVPRQKEHNGLRPSND